MPRPGSPAFRPVRAIALALALVLATRAFAQIDPLPSWNDGPAKARILAFVKAVTHDASPEYVAPARRIAVFDNDGTLWSEQPAYFQLLYAVDRVRSLAAAHPEWRSRQPFKAALEGDLKALGEAGEKGLLELVLATHAGMTTQQFEESVRLWLAEARHPALKRPYTELAYQPMLELLAYLRSSGFKTFIVSGGGIEFLRVWAERVYGVPPEQVIGSTIEVAYASVDGRPALVRQPKVHFIDDRAGKPVGIHYHIGRRPIAAFGNSDGDFQMLEWTTAGPGATLGMIVHHTDAVREFDYDRRSPVGRLDRALDEAPRRGWQVIDMKRDWKTVFRPTSP